MTTSSMPTLYIPHGAGPCFFMDWDSPDTWQRMGDFLRGVLSTLPQPPTAIVIVSSHWEADAFTVGSGEHPAMVFDYNGFPPHTYRLSYPAPGDPGLAARVRSLLTEAGLPTAEDPQRGYDHGVFIPLMLVAPAADIPVVTLSLRRGLDAREHAAAGRALRPLRDEGVLIIGSGMSYHNQRAFRRAEAGPVSERFDAWLAAAVAVTDPDERIASLAAWDAQPDGRASHPREEHLIPLMVAAGAGGAAPGRQVLRDRVIGATVSAFRFD